MSRIPSRVPVVVAALLLLAGGPAAAQFASLTLPPNGDNQKASVSQWMGPVEVTITYHSPDVTSPTGEDRTGKIWGQLVPWGMASLGFGSCGDQCPWRAGANENTVFSVSHDVLIEGQPLAAGSYGLHMIPGQDEWTIIFSNDSTSWGSFFYNSANDALRVTVEPVESEYTHWLTYEFTDRQLARTTVALMWEKLRVPWTVEVEDMPGLYVAGLRRELNSTAGFSHLGWATAANYCVQAGVNLPQALEWAQKAVSDPFVGQEDFQTLSTLARAQAANDLESEAAATFERAARHVTANPVQIHQLGRTLIGEGRPELAMKIFTINYQTLDGAWPSEVGMARGLSALGEYDKALEHARVAVEQAPDELNRGNLESLIKKLEAGEDIN